MVMGTLMTSIDRALLFVSSRADRVAKQTDRAVELSIPGTASPLEMSRDILIHGPQLATSQV